MPMGTRRPPITLAAASGSAGSVRRPWLFTVSTCTSLSRGSQECDSLSNALSEGDAEQRTRRAGCALAKAFDSGTALDAAMLAAAQADALEAEEALKAERRRSECLP